MSLELVFLYIMHSLVKDKTKLCETRAFKVWMFRIETKMWS